MQFDTKIAIVLCEELLTWQKLNVTAFLMSGIVGQDPGLIGEPYRDADGNSYRALAIQPVIVLSAGDILIRRIYERAMGRDAWLSIYTRQMFATGHDAANRTAVSEVAAADLDLVGLALREDRKIVDKITKGAKMHP